VAAVMNNFAKTVVQLEDEEPAVPSGSPGKAVGVQQILLSLLCAAGGDRKSSKAPRGGMAYRLNRTLRGQQVDDK